METVMSFMSGEAVTGGRWQARCWWQWHLLITAGSHNQMSTNCFAGYGGYWTSVFEGWPTHCSGWHLSPFMNFITSLIDVASHRKLATKIW